MIVSWFSAGAASAVATKLAIAEYGSDQVDVYRIDTRSEHPDNVRFAAECEEWFDQPVKLLASQDYHDIWDVFKRRRFLNGPKGAQCTVLLKKQMRFAIEADYDAQVFGYTADANDIRRADRFREQNPELTLVTPLIERMLTKSDCLAMIDRAGIEIPVMYQLGYSNNNCIGCVKGGFGYWNQIRRDFPETFDRMAAQERDLDHALLKDDSGPIFLDELDSDRGDEGEVDFECSLLCGLAEAEIA